MLAKKELRPARRFCRCIKEMVNLTAEVIIQGENVQLSKWKNCEKKDACGYECNYFSAAPLCNCSAGDEKEVGTFEPGIHFVFPDKSNSGKIRGDKGH